MPFYMLQVRYTPDAFKSMLANPQDREPPARKLIEALGGTLHQIFFAMGTEDAMVIVEMPDDETMAAAAMTIAASGAFAGGKTTKLLTTKEAMAAMKRAQNASKSYTPVTG